MPSSVQLYFEGIIAVLLIPTMGIISGFIGAAITGDRAITVGVGCTMMVTTGAVLAARLWRLTRAPIVLEKDGSAE